MECHMAKVFKRIWMDQYIRASTRKERKKEKVLTHGQPLSIMRGSSAIICLTDKEPIVMMMVASM